jgi:hypothetical protein
MDIFGNREILAALQSFAGLFEVTSHSAAYPEC